MTHPLVAQVVVGVPVEGPFDYLIPEELSGRVAEGQRVLVRFAGRKRVGIVVRLLPDSRHTGKLSVLMKVLDEAPVFSAGFVRLADVFSRRFACTSGEAFELFLPAYLREGKLAAVTPCGPAMPESLPAVDMIFDRGQTKRWDILLPRIAATLNAGRGVLVLVPDSARCADVLVRLGPLAKAEERVFLAQDTPKKEYDRWLRVRNGQARLVVGFVSAVFAPVRQLGLVIVIDEESPAYKHDQSPFYHAREVALLRAAIESCAVVCVSSAPSAEMWHKIGAEAAALVRIDEDLAPVRLLDLTNFKMRKGTYISPGLRQLIETTVKGGQKVLCYIQAARGVAGIMAEIRGLLPAARVEGYDKVSAALGADADILVATQVIFRHRAAFKAALAVVLDIDWEFHKHHYQAAHGAFVLVQHLRQMAREQVVLQTRNAADPLLQALAAVDPAAFYARELAQRRAMKLPPFAAHVTVILRSSDPAAACGEAKRLYDSLEVLRPGDVTVLEPQEDRAAVVRGKFRYCVALQGPDRDAVVGLVKEMLKAFRPRKGTVVTVNVD